MTSANLEPSFEDYLKHVGKPVIKEIKKSKKGNWIVPKPFKSRKLINTIKGVIDHPILHIPAFTFEEDDSFVECRRCSVLLNNPTRSRYYGLDLLDEVSYRSWDKNQKPQIGTVLMLDFMDNNRVHVKTEGGIQSWVAEWCQRLNK